MEKDIRGSAAVSAGASSGKGRNMNNRKHAWAILGTAAACCPGLLMILAVGCRKEAEKPAPTTARQEQTATEFVNVRCPIMGTQLDLANVPEGLTRTYKGQKVAFCCAGCPTAWDKLSDAEKDAKLAKVLRKKSD